MWRGAAHVASTGGCQMRENCRMPSLMRVRVGVFKREGLTDSLVKTGQPSLSVGDLPTAVNTRVHHSREERFLR